MEEQQDKNLKPEGSSEAPNVKKGLCGKCPLKIGFPACFGCAAVLIIGGYFIFK